MEPVPEERSWFIPIAQPVWLYPPHQGIVFQQDLYFMTHGQVFDSNIAGLCRSLFSPLVNLSPLFKVCQIENNQKGVNNYWLLHLFKWIVRSETTCLGFHTFSTSTDEPSENLNLELNNKLQGEMRTLWKYIGEQPFSEMGRERTGTSLVIQWVSVLPMQVWSLVRELSHICHN